MSTSIYQRPNKNWKTDVELNGVRQWILATHR